ncbi:MAG: hypothetical protein M9890_10235 [Thermomicrobiales bacterium]|nr:hypothetical protein [Thermomicrobiales bacterium]
MQQIHTGQCGLCTHFGENKPNDVQIIQIRTKHEAPETFVSACGHPKHAALDLRVTPISSCAGFEMAQDVQAD